MSAVRAICSPKVGPIEFDEKSPCSTPKRSSSVSWTSCTSSGARLGVAIWNTVSPSSGSSTFWIFESP